MTEIDARQREILRLLWREGRMSRWKMHLEMGVNPNAIGLDVGTLLQQGIVRELQARPKGPGRPRIPVEIDPATRHMVGLSIGPGRVQAARLNLRGDLLDKPRTRRVARADKMIPTAGMLLRSSLNDGTLAVGVSITGLIDPNARQILHSSSVPGQSGTSLQPLYQAAGNHPLILENNMHALTARWLLTHHAEANQDVLLVSIGDGELGAALLIDGRPNRGCAYGANELGHTRFFVNTDVCYCGHPGCLERICSTAFLRRCGVSHGALMEHAARFDGAGDGTRRAMEKVLDYLSAGLANVVNLIRPNRLVLVSELTRYPAAIDVLLRSVRARVLAELVTRMRIDLWDVMDSRTAETAGWLALASLYHEGWKPE